MLDPIERGYADRVKEGCPVDHLQPLHPKTELYGQLAREILTPINLDEIDANMQAFRGRTVKTLAAALNSELYQQAEAARRSADTERLDDLFMARYLGPDFAGARMAMSHERVTTGVKAAADAEELTLMTLKHQIMNRGRTITLDGARASQRVPFALALMSIGTLNPTLLRVVKRLPQSECAGENGEVLTDDIWRLHPRRGLMLTHEFERRVVKAKSSEPHLGCPATLLAGFIRRFHDIAVYAAVRNDIIPVSG